MGTSCDTCGRTESKDVKMTEDNKLIVCIDCATNLFLLSRPDLQPPPKSFVEEVGYSTKDIYKKLSESVIGQDKAKKVLSVALINHMKRIVKDPTIEKTNVLLLGSTGTGKTALVTKLAEMTSLPLGIADANSITNTGWAGNDPESVLLDLYYKSGNNSQLASKGIVFIDEIDKLAKDSDDRYASQNAQRGFLRILEGSTVEVPVKEGGKVSIDTRQILFICAGAFSGLQEIINRRKSKKAIGFNSSVVKEDFSEEEATTEDLEQYGLIPEFLGRVPARARLDNLDIQQLRSILTKSSNSLTSQYIKMFEIDGIDLQFSSTGLEEIAKQAKDLKIGARGLRTILEKVLFDYQFDYQGMKLYITKDIVLEKLGLLEQKEDGVLEQDLKRRSI